MNAARSRCSPMFPKRRLFRRGRCRSHLQAAARTAIEQGLDDIVAKRFGLEPAARGPVRLGPRSRGDGDIPHHEVSIGFVGKYVDHTDAYKSLNESLAHAGVHTRTTRSTSSRSTPISIETDGIDALKGLDAILVPGRFRQPRHRGQDRRGQLRAHQQRALSRHLPRHAGRGHRVRAQRAGPVQGAQLGVQSENARSGHRAGHRVDRSRRFAIETR